MAGFGASWVTWAARPPGPLRSLGPQEPQGRPGWTSLGIFGSCLGPKHAQEDANFGPLGGSAHVPPDMVFTIRICIKRYIPHLGNGHPERKLEPMCLIEDFYVKAGPLGAAGHPGRPKKVPEVVPRMACQAPHGRCLHPKGRPGSLGKGAGPRKCAKWLSEQVPAVQGAHLGQGAP